MYIIENDNYVIIPFDFNSFYNMAKEYKKNIRYSREYTISENFFDELYCYVMDTSKDKIVLDMKNIVSYPTRMFSRLQNFLEKIIFYNVDNPKMKQMLMEDLENLQWTDDTIACSSCSNKHEIKAEIDKSCMQIRKKEQSRVISNLANCEKGKVHLLESSGLYSNCYVDTKKLFTNVDDFYYIVYSLAELISERLLGMEIDAFVSSSKNGAILANILGGLLDIKEVHLIGIGPKYSMELGDSVECLKPGKKYAYIFDFMCTGTELKIVSALVNSKKAYLPYAVGIARYKKDIDIIGIEHMDVLVDTKEMNVDYKIAGEKGDLLKVME